MATFKGQQISSAERPGVREPVYLHVELRDLPGLIQRLGSQQAAAAMFKFGETVRQAVTSFPGTEIKSEGDSYLCVCPSAGSAIGTAEAILLAAAGGDGSPGLTVACGIVLGEGASSLDGYLMAARMGGAAPDGSCLVSDAIRELAPDGHSYVRARAIERASGSKDRLWLVEAPVATIPASAPRSSRPGRVLVAFGAAIVVIALLATAAYGLLKRGGAGVLPPGPWTIAAQLPINPERGSLGSTLVNAAQLVVNDANAQGGVDGQQLVFEVKDEGEHDQTEPATTSINSFASDSTVVGVVGPLQSPHGFIDIPVTNAAGLLQCSPGNTNPSLTKPRSGALDIRSAAPNRINFVRVISSDDIQAPAAASFIFQSPTTGIPDAGIPNKAGLGVRHVLVIDDDTDSGSAAAESFEKAFAAVGGTTERRSVNPGTTDYSTILAPLADNSNGPWAVYYGGEGQGGAELKMAMASAGYGEVPLVSWDGLFDGSGTDVPSYINSAGAAASNTYVTSASIAPMRADFSRHYQDTFGDAPNSYAAAAAACTQIVIDALQQAGGQGVDAAGVREAVRANAVNPASRFDTAIGTVGFDANGDDLSQFVDFYKVDMGANGGAGDWVYLDEQDFGPAP